MRTCCVLPIYVLLGAFDVNLRSLDVAEILVQDTAVRRSLVEMTHSKANYLRALQQDPIFVAFK